MAEKSYADRDVLDKLGVKEGMRVLVAGDVPEDLRRRLGARSGLEVVDDPGEGRVNLVLFAPADGARVKGRLDELRGRIAPDGAIWVLTPKRGQTGYVRQEALIPQGKAVGLVDNKVCSVDERTSAIRFVIPVAQRERGTAGEVE